MTHLAFKSKPLMIIVNLLMSCSLASRHSPRHRACGRARAGFDSLPGMTVVCGDSHTATHGALAVWLMALVHQRLNMCLRPNVWLPKNEKHAGACGWQIGQRRYPKDAKVCHHR